MIKPLFCGCVPTRLASGSRESVPNSWGEKDQPDLTLLFPDLSKCNLLLFLSILSTRLSVIWRYISGCRVHNVLYCRSHAVA